MGYIHTSHILGGDTSVTGVPLHPVPQVQDLEQTVQGLPYLRRSLPDQLQAGGQVNRLAAAAAGGVALPLAVGIMHPLDTVRTTMQATAGRGFSEVVKALGSKGVARGFGLSFAWASPQGAIRMASYETSKEHGVHGDDSEILSKGALDLLYTKENPLFRIH